MIERRCLGCNEVLTTRYKIKYCSNRCQAMEKSKKSLNQWKDGLMSGSVGIKSRIISASLRHYLFEKYDNKCSMCGWNEKHSITGNIPLEVDHIDGNAENNHEDNLRLLCPNCHSLTPYFRNLNRKHGRKWRIEKRSG